MSSFFEELEAQLHAAARAQIAVSHPDRWTRRSWTRATAHGIPVLLAVATSIAIAVFALVFIRHKQPNAPVNHSGATPPTASGPPAPLHFNRTQDKAVRYLDKAQLTAFSRDPACSPLPRGIGPPGGKPSLSPGSPSAAILAVLGVLRSPAAPSDRLPPRIIGAPPNQHIYPNGTIPPATGVYARYIRKARHRFGANYYLVPAENVNPLPPIPERCYHEQEVALHQQLGQIPARLRASTLALQPRFLAYQRRSTEPYPGVCLLALNDTGNGDDDCGAGGSLTQIQNGQAVSGGAPTGAEVYHGLAPDGVRSITFYFYSKYVHHPVTTPVINNVFIVRNYRGRLGPIAKEIWHASNGQIIKVIHHP
jgi:hypothetical protein